MSRIRLDEQETTINFSRDGEFAIINTSDTTIMHKLDKLAKSDAYPRWSLVEEYKDRDGDIIMKNYKVDKRLISFRASRSKKELSEQQRQAAIIRMQEYHARKKMKENVSD